MVQENFKMIYFIVTLITLLGIGLMLTAAYLVSVFLVEAQDHLFPGHHKKTYQTPNFHSSPKPE
jgi:hypothetical protein